MLLGHIGEFLLQRHTLCALFSTFARSMRACIAVSSANDIFSIFLLRAMSVLPVGENVYPPPISIASVYKGLQPEISFEVLVIYTLFT